MVTTYVYFWADLNETLEPPDLTLASTAFSTFIHGAASICYRLCGSRRSAHLWFNILSGQGADVVIPMTLV